MNWIEAVFHVDPDGGSGLLELCVLLTVVVPGAMVAGARRRSGSRRSGRRPA